jgi:DNA-binding transcriptional ArsR family regulator
MNYLWVFDENKLLILKALLKSPEKLCGSDILGTLGLKKSLLSYHIRTLMDHGFVISTRCGTKKIYTIPKDKHQRVKIILQAVDIY